MLKYLFVFSLGLLLSYVLTPLVCWLATRVRVLDLPNERKTHTEPVPRLGGVAVFVAFQAAVWLSLLVLPAVDASTFSLSVQWWMGFLPASLIILGLGIFDDVRPLGPAVKFLTQVVAALAAIYFGYVIDRVSLPWGGVWELGWWGVPITALWIVGLTNAFNLIDGLDGLACGAGLIASVTLSAIALVHQQLELALVGMALAGALLGFLRYNFHPARIFLGDSGSLFLGFTLAVLSIKTAHKSSAAVSVLIPLLAFGLPIMETLLSMVRRFLAEAHVVEATPEGKYRFFFWRSRSMFQADSNHIHHRLMQLGIHHRTAVLFLYGVCALLGVAAFALATIHNLNTSLILIAMGVATVVAVQKLRYEELQWLRKGVLLPVARAPLGYQALQIVLDFVAIILAYYLAHWVRFEGGLPNIAKKCFLETLPVVLCVKIIVFYATGLYHVRWERAGMTDLLRGVRSMVLGCFAAGILLSVLPLAQCGWSVLVVDFYLMSTLLLGGRFSLRLLDYYAQADPARKSRVLIYGTDAAASSLVHEIHSNDNLALVPIGFLDDDPQKKGKTLHGYPILGSVADLPALANLNGFQEIIIAAAAIDAKPLNALMEFSRERGLPLRQFQVKLESVVH